MRIIETIDELRALEGQEAAVSDWVTVTQDMIDGFAGVTGDDQWIHVDRARAAADSPYGAPIAHGFLTLSLLSQLSRASIEIRGGFRLRINYGLNRVRFPAAVPAGRRVRGRFAVKAVEDIGEAVQVVWLATIELENSAKPACAAEWVTRLYR
jgi:acyl dehydratase